tara:strand:- start:738 stop:1526 length:789 start_codon:yes stop_codon:yes gene_type:complete
VVGKSKKEGFYFGKSNFFRYVHGMHVQKKWSTRTVKSIFFDTGPIITLVMARLDWVLPLLKEKYGGKFYITPAVRKELVERPMKIKRFEFEALQVLKLIKDGVLEVYSNVPIEKINKLKIFANGAFKIGNKTMDVVQEGELEAITVALELGAEAVVIDERTLRLLIEENTAMEKLLEMRFKRKITVNNAKIKQFSQQFKNLKIIRSIELVSVAYKLGLLDAYIPKQKDGRKMLVDAVLWATKYGGCAVTNHEIEELKSTLLS